MNVGLWPGRKLISMTDIQRMTARGDTEDSQDEE